MGGSFVITVPGVLLFVGSSEEFLDFDFPLQLHHAVKQRFRRWSSDCVCPPHLPRCVCGHRAEVRLLSKKPVLPSREEMILNPRAGSAKLRAAEKLSGPSGSIRKGGRA